MNNLCDLFHAQKARTLLRLQLYNYAMSNNCTYIIMGIYWQPYELNVDYVVYALDGWPINFVGIRQYFLRSEENAAAFQIPVAQRNFIWRRR